MTGLLVTVTVLMSVTLIVLVVGLTIYFKRLSGATRELEATLRVFREEITPLAEEAGRVLRHTNDLVIATRMQVDRVGRAAQSVEDLVEGKTIVGAAERAVSSSRTTLLSMVHGIKEGIKTLRQPKEESNDE